MKRSGTFEFHDGKRCFRPDVPAVPRLEAVQDALERAQKTLGRFDMSLVTFDRPGMIGRLFARLDAVHSSGAEGSTTTFTDLMEFQSSLRTAPDVSDAASVDACAGAMDDLLNRASKPLDAALHIHRRLFGSNPNRILSSEAGRLKSRINGTFDNEEPGGIFHYTAPGSLAETLESWDSFTTTVDPAVPELVRQGLSHWMFEHVHPVADGNGRIGRLLVPLMLKAKGATETACAYFGEAVHEDKEIYLEALKGSRRSGDMTAWVRTFLGFVASTADRNLERLNSLRAIEAEWKDRISHIRSDNAVHRIVPWMLTKPIFTVRDAETATGVSFAAANNALARLMEAGLLEIPDGARRDRLFHASAVLDVFDRFRHAATVDLPSP